MKRRGNRRYYQHHEVLLIRRIRELLYEQGFTISGARNRLAEAAAAARRSSARTTVELPAEPADVAAPAPHDPTADRVPAASREVTVEQMRRELLAIRATLGD